MLSIACGCDHDALGAVGGPQSAACCPGRRAVRRQWRRRRPARAGACLPGASAGKAQQFVQACQYIKKGQAAFPRRRAVWAGHPRASASWVQRLTIQAEGWSAAVQLTCSAGVQMHADIGFLEDNHKRVQAYCAAGSGGAACRVWLPPGIAVAGAESGRQHWREAGDPPPQLLWYNQPDGKLICVLRCHTSPGGANEQAHMCSCPARPSPAAGAERDLRG